MKLHETVIVVETEDVAKELAYCTNIEQATFLNSFSANLEECCEGKKYLKKQALEISKKLDKGTIELLELIVKSSKSKSSATAIRT